MSDVQHWEAKGTAGHQTHGQWAVYDARTGKDIAVVYDGDAHATLIAAAPDLFAACQAALRDIDPMCERTVAQLRAALDRASTKG